MTVDMENCDSDQSSPPHDNPSTATKAADAGLCCFFLRFGVCDPPRPPCRFRHEPDDGISPCCYGPSCRLGHKSRVRIVNWRQHRGHATSGETPAVRDATLLQSQLEALSTGKLRERTARMSPTTITHRELDPLGRAEIMKRLLQAYGDVPRPTQWVRGTRLAPHVCRQLWEELVAWRHSHTGNDRPSIAATSYMILRPPEAGAPESHASRKAARKLQQYQRLYQLAQSTLRQVDAEFCFSALAVTYNFQGSPHIDKQNSGPFYGLSLGDFTGGGWICVEDGVDGLGVAQVVTHNSLAKVDGRFPHWVAPYQGERYSLIYYSTLETYQPPTKSFYGNVMTEEEATGWIAELKTMPS